MAIGKPLEELMSKIGYSFANEEYLQNALTHSSYSNEYRSRGLNLPSNERLEFLGDAVLQLVISEYIYHNYTDLAEGRLTRIRQNLVCEKTLARVAKKYNVGDKLPENEFFASTGEEFTANEFRSKNILTGDLGWKEDNWNFSMSDYPTVNFDGYSVPNEIPENNGTGNYTD